jgi:hypothetical protein
MQKKSTPFCRCRSRQLNENRRDSGWFLVSDADCPQIAAMSGWMLTILKTRVRVAGEHAEGMFHRLAALAHGQGVLVEALPRRLQLRRNPPFTCAKKAGYAGARHRAARCADP